MSKPKYQKPVLSSIGLPIKRAQGFDILGWCSTGNLAGGSGGSCTEGLALADTIEDYCDLGLYANGTCVGGDRHLWAGVEDGCFNGNTNYGGGADSCASGTNPTE